MLVDLSFINLDDFAKFFRYIVCQGGLLPWLNGLCRNFHLTILRPPPQMCEKYYTLSNYKSFALVFILFVILLHNIFPVDKPLWLFWLLKALILAYMLYFCRYSSERKIMRKII